MKKWWLIVSALFVVIVVGTVVLVVVPAPTANVPTTKATTTTPASPLADLIVVDAPVSGAKVASPLAISGKARGSWYFEASAPVTLFDANGKRIAEGHLTAQGNWMTDEFVPFTAKLTYPSQPAGTTGILRLQNDNPSGDPTKQKELDILIKF